VQNDEHGVREAAEAEQPSGERVLVMVLHRDRHDAGGHHDREVTRIQGADRLADRPGTTWCVLLSA
jgi:hypothetical protein